MTSFQTKSVWLAAAATAALNAAPREAAAQSAIGASVEQIVVTAQKREETLQDTPISITAFTADAIARAGATNIQELAAFAPNVTFDFTSPVSGASNAAAIFIRGVGQQDFALTSEAGVGTYVDGVYMSRSIGGVLDVLDIERIEVLRGPQGTLFGRNAIGGAINIITKRPTDELEGTFEVAAGNQQRRHVRGSVSAPINDVAGFTFSGAYRHRDGYVDRIFDGDPSALNVDPRAGLVGDLNAQGEEDRLALRGAFIAELTPALDIDITADYARGRETSAANILVGVTDSLFTGLFNTFQAPGITLPGFANTEYSAENFVTGDFDSTFATGPNGSEFDSWGVSGTVSLDLGETATVKSISAYRRTDAAFFRDPDGSPLVFAQTLNPDYEHRQFSQEVQLIGSLAERLDYIAGFYYFNEIGSDPLSAVFPESFGTLEITQADIDNTSWAVFGQATAEITQALALTFGIRYTEDRKEFDTEQTLITGSQSPIVFGAPPGVPIPITPPGASERETFTDVSPRASIEYEAAEGVNLYASYSQGFKSGGFNLRYVLPVQAIIPFDPEEVNAYEIGGKFRTPDGRAQVSIAGFFTDYKDIQVTLFDDNAAPVTVNAGEADIFGVELEAAVAPFEGLLITGGAGFTDAEYTEIRSPSGVITGDAQIVTLDTELANTPRWNANLTVQYDHDMGAYGLLSPRVAWSYQGDTQNDAQNSPFLFQEAYSLVDASLAYRPMSERWEIRAFGENLTDKRIIVSGDSNFALGFHEANVNRPRQWGVSVRAFF